MHRARVTESGFDEALHGLCPQTAVPWDTAGGHSLGTGTFRQLRDRRLERGLARAFRCERGHGGGRAGKRSVCRKTATRSHRQRQRLSVTRSIGRRVSTLSALLADSWSGRALGLKHPCVSSASARFSTAAPSGLSVAKSSLIGLQGPWQGTSRPGLRGSASTPSQARRCRHRGGLTRCLA